MNYRVINHQQSTEILLPDGNALFAWAQRFAPWALDPPPAAADDLAERLDASQSLSVEAEPEGPRLDVADLRPTGDPWRAARILAGEVEPGDEEAVREAQVAHEDDEVAQALRAAGLDPEDQDARQQVRNLADLMSPEAVRKDEVAGEGPIVPLDAVCRPVSPASGDLAQALQQAAATADFRPFRPGKGKHSEGMMVATTDLGEILIKPGSGRASPCLGVREQPASQAQREAAAWYALRAMGLERYAVRAEVVGLQGHPVAAMEFLPDGPDDERFYWTLGKALAKDRAGTQLRLLPLLAQGTLHRLALALWVIGDPDANQGNALTRRDDPLRLIDHGSALAGPSFDPARDPKAYCPAFLRAWSPRTWARLAPDERLAGLPRLAAMAEVEVRAWWGGVDVAALRSAVGGCGAVATATTERAQLVTKLLGVDLADVVINRLWAVGKPQEG